MPLGLVVAAVLSFWVDAHRLAAADAARDFGMSGAAVQSAMNAIAEQHHARWYFLLAGSSSSSGSAAASSAPCYVAHSVAWGLRPEKLRRPMTAGLVFSGIVVAADGGPVVDPAAARSSSAARGSWLTLWCSWPSTSVVLWIMEKLPHRSASWRDLLPGAVLVALGTQVIHLAVVLYLAPKIGRSSELYGALGAATVILLWLYLARAADRRGRLPQRRALGAPRRGRGPTERAS